MRLIEVIEAGPQGRKRELLEEGFFDILEGEVRPLSYLKVRAHLAKIDEDTVKGQRILEQAEVTSVLRELGEVVGTTSLGAVELNSGLARAGMVSQMVSWAPKEGSLQPSAVIVLAVAETEDLIVQGRENELLRADCWRKDRSLLVRAVADAYLAPAQISWPPGRRRILGGD